MKLHNIMDPRKENLHTHFIAISNQKYDDKPWDTEVPYFQTRPNVVLGHVWMSISAEFAFDPPMGRFLGTEVVVNPFKMRW